jgi:hypothetical protein
VALIPVLISFVPLTTIKSADVNTNFSAIQTAFNASAVLTDVAKTVAVTHTWTSSQTFTGGFTTGAAVTLGGGLLFSADNTYDIGAPGANRPRNLYAAGFLSAGGNIFANIGGSTFVDDGSFGLVVTRAAGFPAINWSRTGAGATSASISLAAGGILQSQGGLAVGGALTAASDITGVDGHFSRTATTGYVYFGSNASQWIGFNGTDFDVHAGSNLSGRLVFASDNTYDIGVSGANRPRNLYVAGAGSFGALVTMPQLQIASNSAFVPQIVVRDTDSTSYGSIRIYNDTNVGTRALELDYSGSAYPSTIIGSAPAGECGAIYTSGNYPMVLGQASSARFVFDTSGNIVARAPLLFTTDNSYDIGQAGANRPRTLYVAGAGNFGGLVTVANQLTLNPSGQTYALLSTGSTSVIGQLTNTNAAGFGLILKANNDANYTFTIINAANTLNTVHIYGDGHADFLGIVTNGGLLTGGHHLFSVDNTYNIGAAAASRPANIYCAGTIFSASSRDLKQDIRPSHVDALSVVRRTRIVDFKYRANPDVDAIGFIAEDTHELLSGKSRKEFNINNTLGVLLKAVQELETQVSELKRKAA